MNSDVQRALDGLRDGVRLGLWDDVDESALLPVKRISMADFHGTATMAHAWHSIGKFKSMKEAKRAGWNKPLSAGRFRVGTWVIDVVGDNE